MVVDLDDADLRPDAWLRPPSPPLAHPVDQVVYELHVRDFSRADKTVPDALRGTFAAFAVRQRGTRHLRRLAEAGLTSVQLLPIFDYSSVDEDPLPRSRVDGPRSRRPRPTRTSSSGCPRPGASTTGATTRGTTRCRRGRCAPRRRSTTGGRVREARVMVGALHALGLRVVLDQVYNHTDGAGQGGTSVLDRIVPGYYHRRR